MSVNLKKINTVIFDMDGVIIDSEPYQLEQHKEYMSSLNIYPAENELFKLVGASQKLTRELLRPILKPEITVEDYFEGFKNYHKNNVVCYKEIINKGTIETLNQLLNIGYSLALASSASMQKIEKVIKQCNLEGFFKVILSGDAFEHSKPNPEIYLKAAEKMNTSPNKCLVVEDSEHGIIAGKNAGMYIVAKEETRFNLYQHGANEIIKEIPDLLKVLSYS